MPPLEELLRQRVTQGEADLRTAVRSVPTGVVLRGYLPQTWVLITDRETLTIHADMDGKITMKEGNTIIRDGAISIPHDLLVESITTGKSPPRNSLRVTFYTEKGEEAYKHLASYFGL